MSRKIINQDLMLFFPLDCLITLDVPIIGHSRINFEKITISIDIKLSISKRIK